MIKVIGRGSYSTVYKVQRLSDGKFYALKQTDVASLNARERKDMVNEIRCAARWERWGGAGRGGVQQVPVERNSSSNSSWYLGVGVKCCVLNSNSSACWCCLRELPRPLGRRLLASLEHPNLLQCFEAFCDHHQLCIVTDLATGDLGSLIE